MEQALRRAVAGGYEPFKTVKMSELECELRGEHFNCNFKPLENGAQARGICSANLYRMLYDPLFWQALGKVENWVEMLEPPFFSQMPIVTTPQWRYQWHRFIDWIAEGKDIDTFFNQLLK